MTIEGLPKRLFGAREAAGLTQEQVSRATGIPRPSLSDIERGKRRTQLEELIALASVYGTTIDALLGNTADAGADGRSEFRVAVTVFVTAQGVDQLDASHGAEIAIRHALRTVAVEPGVLETPHARLGPFRVQVHKVMDTPTAGINGYLATRPTNRAFREDM